MLTDAMMTLGEFIRERRENLDLSLRELARRAQVTAPFLSDIELGRRYPSDEVLVRLSTALGVTIEELRTYDNRAPVEGLKKLAESNPKYGLAFRRIIDNKVTADELLRLADRKTKPTKQ